MKIQAKYPEYPINSLKMPTKNEQGIGFEGNSAVSETPRIDRILKSPFVQGVFKTAGRTPHVIRVGSVGVLGLTLRPATLLAVPGAKKEDKQYVAAKSIIGTALFVVSQLLITLPLDKSLKSLAEKAKKNPASIFNKYSSKQLSVYSFFVSEAVALAFTLATTSYLTVKLTTKIMTKLFPQKEKGHTQKPQGKERVV